MAKFVIAGEAGCCSYARAEMLGDTLAAHLPNFKVTKVVISSEEWPSWLSGECDGRGWCHSKGSPLVWRELVDTGGKGLYLGGLAEFEAYATKYHSISPPTEGELEKEIAAENLQTYQQKQLEKKKLVPVQPVKVCLTNCDSPLAYHLAHLVANGAMLGPTQKVAIHLYLSEHSSICEGLAIELLDLASPLLEYTKVTSSLLEAFDGINLAFILDYPYSAQNLKLNSSNGRRTELANAAVMFQKYANALDFAASKDVKVLVSGCFANTGAGLMTLCASSLSPNCFVAAPCLAESQAKAVLASRLQLNSSDVKQFAVWGKTHGMVLADHSSTRIAHFPGAVVGPDPFDLPLSKCEFNTDWLENEFPKLMVARHEQLEGYSEQGPSLAEAVGLAKLGYNWILGDTLIWQSVGVVSDGNLQGVPSGVACSVPCQCKEGKWEPVPDLVPPKHIMEQLTVQVNELKSELEAAALTLGITPTSAAEPSKSPDTNTESLPSKSPDTESADTSTVPPNITSKSPETESANASTVPPNTSQSPDTESPNTTSKSPDAEPANPPPNTESLANTTSKSPDAEPDNPPPNTESLANTPDAEPANT